MDWFAGVRKDSKNPRLKRLRVFSRLGLASDSVGLGLGLGLASVGLGLGLALGLALGLVLRLGLV